MTQIHCRENNKALVAWKLWQGG